MVKGTALARMIKAHAQCPGLRRISDEGRPAPGEKMMVDEQAIPALQDEEDDEIHHL